jgi:hypothetical protein
VKLELFYVPKGFVETAGDSIGIVSLRVENDLKRFKEFIENRRRKQVRGAAPLKTLFNALRNGDEPFDHEA